jgi:hypothetical protein
LPGVPVVRTESYVSSIPAGSHARIDRTSIALKEDPPVPVVPA